MLVFLSAESSWAAERPLSKEDHLFEAGGCGHLGFRRAGAGYGARVLRIVILPWAREVS